MRLSAKFEDPGFAKYTEIIGTHAIKVFVDDVEIEGPITADDVEGFVDRYMRDDLGSIVIRRGTMDEAVVERMTGKVRIDLVLRKANG